MKKRITRCISFVLVFVMVFSLGMPASATEPDEIPAVHTEQTETAEEPAAEEKKETQEETKTDEKVETPAESKEKVDTEKSEKTLDVTEAEGEEDSPASVANEIMPRDTTRVEVSAVDTEGNTIPNATTPSGIQPGSYGQEFTITANAVSGYSFMGWWTSYDDYGTASSPVSSSPSYTFRSSGSEKFVAVYEFTGSVKHINLSDYTSVEAAIAACGTTPSVIYVNTTSIIWLEGGIAQGQDITIDLMGKSLVTECFNVEGKFTIVDSVGGGCISPVTPRSPAAIGVSSTGTLIMQKDTVRGYMYEDGSVTGSGYIVADGGTVEIKIDAAARVTTKDGATEYETFSEALENASGGATITLLKDASYRGNLSIENKLTLDLNGKTLNLSGGSTTDMSNMSVSAEIDIVGPGSILGDKDILISNSGTLNFSGDGNIALYQKNTISSSIKNNGTINLLGGKLVDQNQNNNISLKLGNGNIRVAGGEVYQIIAHYDNGSITVEKGKVDAINVSMYNNAAIPVTIGKENGEHSDVQIGTLFDYYCQNLTLNSGIIGTLGDLAEVDVIDCLFENKPTNLPTGKKAVQIAYNGTNYYKVEIDESQYAACVINGDSKSYYGDMFTAIDNAPAGATVKLLKDVSGNYNGYSGYTLNKNLTLDLNNKTITITGYYSERLMKNSDSANLTVKNGTIENKYASQYVFEWSGGNLRLEKVALNANYSTAIYATNSADIYVDKDTIITGSSNSSIGNRAEYLIVLELCKLVIAKEAEIVGDIDASYAEVTVNGKIRGKMSTWSTLTYIDGAIITADEDDSYAISIDDAGAELHISSGTITGNVEFNWYASDCTITGGDFYGDVSYIGRSKFISGGTFSQNVSEAVKDGYVCSPINGGRYEVTKETVATVTVGDVTREYTSLTDAWEAAQGKTATVNLLKDQSIGRNESLTIDDAASHITLTMEEGVTLSGREIIVINAGELTVAGGKLNGNPHNAPDECTIYVGSGSTLNVTGGEIYGNADAITVWGTAYITGGVITSGDEGLSVRDTGMANISGGQLTWIVVYKAGSTKISGGTIGGIDIYRSDNTDTLKDLLDTTTGNHLAYYNGEGDSKTLITEGLDGKSLYGTITVAECTHSFGEWEINADETQTRTCAACGATEIQDVVATVTIDGETTGYASFVDAWEAAQGHTATITLKKYVELDKTLEFTDYNTKITLSMTGEGEIEFFGAEEQAAIHVSCGELEIDSGTIYGNGYGVYVFGGKLVVSGGNIEGQSGGGIYVHSGQVTVIDGNISGNCAITAGIDSSVTIDGGTFAGINYGLKTDMIGYAVIRGGTFSGGTKAVSSSGQKIGEMLYDGFAYYTGETVARENIITSGLDGFDIDGAVTVAECLHSYGDWTDNKDGNHIQECIVCGAAETEAHTFGEWANDTEVPGTQKRICEDCGFTETRAKDGWYKLSDYRNESGNTAPTKDGYIFAGWYTSDTEFTMDTALKQGAEEPEYAFAKFVDEKVLTVKFQITYGTNGTDEKTVLRLVTTVDSLLYSSIGFNVSYNDKSYDMTTSKVYEKLTGTDGVGAFTYKPTVFSEDSLYFAAYNTDVMNNLFSTPITVTPRWVTLDGTVVDGTSRVIVIENSASFQK